MVTPRPGGLIPTNERGPVVTVPRLPHAARIDHRTDVRVDGEGMILTIDQVFSVPQARIVGVAEKAETSHAVLRHQLAHVGDQSFAEEVVIPTRGRSVHEEGVFAQPDRLGHFQQVIPVRGGEGLAVVHGRFVGVLVEITAQILAADHGVVIALQRADAALHEPFDALVGVRPVTHHVTQAVGRLTPDGVDAGQNRLESLKIAVDIGDDRYPGHGSVSPRRPATAGRPPSSASHPPGD
jgi:hypothetical protein